MPRRSRASFGVVPVVSAPREPPPASLGPEERAEWVRVVESLPVNWFPGASYVLLEIHVRSVVSMRWLAAEMDQHVRGSPGWHQWHKLYDKEARQVSQLALRLRLHPRWERTTLKAVPSGVRPWDLGGDDDGAPMPEGRTFDQLLAEEAARKNRRDDNEPPTDPEGSPAA